MSDPTTPEPASNATTPPPSTSLGGGGSVLDSILYEMTHHDDHMIGPYAKTDKVPVKGMKAPTRLAASTVQFDEEKLGAMGLDAVTQLMGEITHLAMLHPDRRKALTGGLKSLEPVADIAANLATFHNLANEKRTMSKKFPMPGDFGFAEGLSIEEYFGLLYEKATQQGIDLESLQQPQPGQGQPNTMPGQGQPQPGQGQPQPGNSPGSGGGGGSQDPPTPEEQLMQALGVDPNKKFGQDHSQWGNVPSGAQEQIKEAMIEYFNRFRGTLPMGAQRLLKLLEEEKDDRRWQSILRNLVGKHFSSTKWQSTMKKPSRRWGIGYPGKKRIKRGDIIIALDTSGSMDDYNISMALHHAATVAKNHGAPVEVWAVDVDIHTKKKIKRPKDVAMIDIKGGGGTSSIQVFDEIAKRKRPLDLLIYLTDLYIDFPDKAPKGYEVIWGIINNPDGHPPFGKEFHIKTDDEKRNRSYRR